MDTGLFPAERAFRAWMLVSALTFAFAVPFFLFGGVFIVPAVNFVSAHVCPLPLYPLPQDGMEGAFWRVLAVSMMAMLTWACWKIYRDVRLHADLTPIVLVSKCCSTSMYLALFASHHYLAYLVGALTDGPIFLVTWLLWFMARPADQYLDRREEDIIFAMGDALIPPDGAYETGFIALRTESLADLRRSLATLAPLSLFGLRLIIRVLNIAPILSGIGRHTLLKAPRAERPALLAGLESHRLWVFRWMTMTVKAILMIAFFNQPEASRAVGFDPEARIRP